MQDQEILPVSAIDAGLTLKYRNSSTLDNMNKTDDPLSDPDLALRVFQHRQKRIAIILIVYGVAAFAFFLIPLTGRASLTDRVNSLTTIVAGLVSAFSVFSAGLGIKILVRGNPLVKLVLDLNERVQKLEAKN